jgi:hypothetical protein
MHPGGNLPEPPQQRSPASAGLIVGVGAAIVIAIIGATVVIVFDHVGRAGNRPGSSDYVHHHMRRMRQVLSWALARSPGPRRRAWARLASFWDCGLLRPLYGVITWSPVSS